MKSSFLLIISVFVVVLTIDAQKEPIRITTTPLTKYLEPTDYNGGIQNWSFAQDTSGILYVANNFGLREFDGGNWSSYDVPNSTKLRSLFIDQNNRIYVGGQGQIGFFFKNETDFVFVSLIERLPVEKRGIEEVWKIIELNETIYFNTSNKLFSFVGDTFEEVEMEGQIQRAFKVGNSLIVQIQNEGLFLLEENKLSSISGTDEILDEVIAIIETDNGFIPFTVSGSIYRYNNGIMTRYRGLDNQLNAAAINTCIRLSNGNIAIGTQNEGLFLLDENLILRNHFTKNQGLNNRTVIALHEDNFKNLWVGLNNGINYLELSSPLSLINEESGLEGTGYAATLFNGKIYLGTNNGLFTQLNKNANDFNYQLMDGTEGQVYNLSKIDGALLLSHHRGAFQVVGDQVQQFLDVGSWRFISTSKPGLIVGGTYEGISLFEKKDDTWTRTHEVDNLSESSRILEFDNDSTLWMTHGYKGVYLVEFDRDLQKTKRVRFFGADDGLPSNILNSVYSLGETQIFTGEFGIYNFNQDSSQFVPNQFLTGWLGEEHISNITSSSNGDIFFVAASELGYLKQLSFGTFKKQQNVFKRINKFINDDLENISILDDQNVLIGAKEGFIHFDPTQNFEIAEEFNVVLKSADVMFENDSTQVYLGEFLEGMEFEKNQSIKFHFASPYFDGFDDLVYAYRLVGFDHQWSEWSAETFKEYTNLPPGEFTFEVKARNIYESESEVLSKTFGVIPKWYQSNLAYALYAALAVFIFGLISFSQSKRHKKETKMLHLSKEEAIKSKDEELSQVSHQSKIEIENLRNEKLKSDIDYKNNELASVTMHLLNKNEFVNGVRKRIETIVSENGSSKDELKRIIKTIDRNLHEDDSWDQFAFHFDQVHGDFLKKLSHDEIKLTPQETKLAAYLRMNMSSKEIANLMNISVRGVELARYRLRKKLNLERDQNLVDHLLQL